MKVFLINHSEFCDEIMPQWEIGDLNLCDGLLKQIKRLC